MARRRGRKGARARQSGSREAISTYSFTWVGRLSPGNEFKKTRADLKCFDLQRPFRLQRLIVQAVAADTATANAIQIGGACIQLESYQEGCSNPVHVSGPYIIGSTPRTMTVGGSGAWFDANWNTSDPVFRVSTVKLAKANYELGCDIVVTAKFLLRPNFVMNVDSVATSDEFEHLPPSPEGDSFRLFKIQM